MKRAALILFVIALAGSLTALSARAGSLAAGDFEWPAWREIFRVLALQDYNTRVVVIGTTLLGLAAGLIGTFLVLRKRALLSDALSHATLPGIALAFMIMTAMGLGGKNLLGLILGAAVFSVLGTVSVLLIQRYSRLKDDAALGIVLSGYFGLGITLMGLATRMASGDAAGLSSFIYGKTASMLFFDALLIAAAALIAAVSCLLFFKEFSLICFDAGYAATQGWPVFRLDFLMMTLAVIVTVIGLQAVGLILVVALLIIPPASARFWTFDLRRMLWLSGGFGALSGLSGSAISAVMANLPSGAVIVLSASGLFLISLIFGSARGLLRIGLERRRLRKKIDRENLLRAFYEWLEACHADRNLSECMDQRASFDALLSHRSWTSSRLSRVLKSALKEGWVEMEAGAYGLTTEGFEKARQVIRNHRLWETYLITHADVAPGQVDWGADQIEHILDAQMIAELEKRLPETLPDSIPDSPHRIRASQGAA